MGLEDSVVVLGEGRCRGLRRSDSAGGVVIADHTRFTHLVPSPAGGEKYSTCVESDVSASPTQKSVYIIMTATHSKCHATTCMKA